MSIATQPEGSAPPGSIHFHIPGWVWGVGLVAFLLHMAPYWRAAGQAPDGWVFTGNLHGSPDYMQYRVWARQSQEEGLFVSNRFTAEANSPHLPMLLYWSIGRLATATGVSPEWVYAWLGGILALVLVVVLYPTVRHFLPSATAAAWVYWVLIVGGGLGGILVWIRDTGLASRHVLLERLAVAPLHGPGYAAPFEDYRGNYVLQAIMDGHFVVLWLAALVGILMLYRTVIRFSPGRLLATAAVFAAATFLHLYEGLLLLAVTAGVCLICWRKGWSWRQALATLITCGVAVGAVLLPLAMRFDASGLPLPSWRGVIVAPVVLLLAYPLAWFLWAIGLGRYWRESGLPGAFLLGWALGCLAITLSGPFYPYPDRGILTLQIPMLIMAGMIYFARRRRPGLVAAIAVIVLHVSTPMLLFGRLPERTRFNSAATYKWVSTSHLALARALHEVASPEDLLVADEAVLRWLAPGYTGRHFAGHFFLTTDYERKRTRVREFFATDDPMERAAFLAAERISLLYVSADQDPRSFLAIPGVRPLVAESVGTLFAVTAAPSSGAVQPSDERTPDDRPPP